MPALTPGQLELAALPHLPINTCFGCRPCGRLHVLTDAQEVERKGTPITMRCQCGARYQITRTEVRYIERPLPIPPLL